jgi:hypothetical protein
MVRKLVKLERAPMAHRWNLLRVTERGEYYSNGLGRQFMKDRATGVWYAIVTVDTRNPN